MLQQLWIMRHGLAENEFSSDFERALSATGKKQVEQVVAQWKLAGHVLPKKMLVSPFARTQQTAQVVLSQLDQPVEVETEDLLVHYADHKILADFLLVQNISHLWLVSHMPIVARLAQYLTNDLTIAGFETAQLVGIKFDNGLASVNYLYRHNLN